MYAQDEIAKHCVCVNRPGAADHTVSIHFLLKIVLLLLLVLQDVQAGFGTV